eukprot:gene8060-9470_t
MTTDNQAMEMLDSDLVYVNEQMSPLGGLFGEDIAFQGFVESNRNEKDISMQQRILVIEIAEPAVGGPVASQEAIELRYKDTTANTVCTIYIKAPTRAIESIIIKSLVFTSYTISRGFPESARIKISLPRARYTPIAFNHDFGNDGTGIAELYIAHSHYFKRKATLDYLRHLETLYVTRYPSLDLSQVPGVDAASSLGFNLFTSIICLRHNPFIKELRISNVPHINVIASVGEMMQTNTSISELTITNLLTEQSFAPLGQALASNPGSGLQRLILSDNMLTYESVTALADGLAHFAHSLLTLDISRCDIPPRGVALIIGALERNFAMSLTLETIVLGGNRFQTSGSAALASWLSKSRGYNKLKELDLKNAQLDFTIISAPLRALDCLERIDLSSNKITLSSARLLATEAFECLPSIKTIILDECALVADSLQHILVGLGRNKKLPKSSVTLSLSQNGFAGKSAGRLTQILPESTYLCGLDLSLNNFNTKQLTDIITSLASINLTSLNLGYNSFNSYDDSLIAYVADYVSKHSSLTKLGLATARPFGASLHPLIQLLNTNKSLVALDLTGNAMNDHGACLLSDCLRNNKTLKRLFIAGNVFTGVGWCSLAAPLVFYRNTTLTSLELPSPSDLISISDANTQPLVGSARDALEQTFNSVRLQLALNKNKVSGSSRFAYLPPSDPPMFVQPPAQVPEHLAPAPDAKPDVRSSGWGLRTSSTANPATNGKSPLISMPSIFAKPINSLIHFADIKEIPEVGISNGLTINVNIGH